MADLMPTPLVALEPYVQALLAALEDARTYRLGDVRCLNDPDLDMDDRQHVLRYEDLERQLRMVVDECTRCGHRHLVECDGTKPDPDPEGDHALMHCGCEAPEPEQPACPACRRIPLPDDHHQVLAGTSGPDDSPEPEYVCLDDQGAVLAPMPTDPWTTQAADAEPPF